MAFWSADAAAAAIVMVGSSSRVSKSADISEDGRVPRDRYGFEKTWSAYLSGFSAWSSLRAYSDAAMIDKCSLSMKVSRSSV